MREFWAVTRRKENKRKRKRITWKDLIMKGNGLRGEHSEGGEIDIDAVQFIKWSCEEKRKKKTGWILLIELCKKKKMEVWLDLEKYDIEATHFVTCWKRGKRKS